MSVIESVRFELRRSRRLGERALAQIERDDWYWKPDDDANSIAITAGRARIVASGSCRRRRAHLPNRYAVHANNADQTNTLNANGVG